MSTSKAARAHTRKVEADRAKYLRRIDEERRRATLEELRAELRAAREKHAGAVAIARAVCRHNRHAVRAEIKAQRAALLAALRENARQLRQSARQECANAKWEARGHADAKRKRTAEVQAERAYLANQQRIERAHTRKRAEAVRAHARERASESDDEVRANIDPSLIALFDRVKGQIRGSARRSRTEAFLQYVEENPREYLTAIDDQSEALVRDLEARERAERKRPPRRRYTAAELAEVPF